jgi:uncharacterized protein (DUF433 family)
MRNGGSAALLENRPIPACHSSLVTRHFLLVSRRFKAQKSIRSLQLHEGHSPDHVAMNSVIKIDPEIMSGAPCFAGTRVPIQNLIDYLEGGDSIDEFLEDFPSVKRDQVISFLEEAKESVLARAV